MQKMRETLGSSVPKPVNSHCDPIFSVCMGEMSCCETKMPHNWFVATASVQGVAGHEVEGCPMSHKLLMPITQKATEGHVLRVRGLNGRFSRKLQLCHVHTPAPKSGYPGV